MGGHFCPTPILNRGIIVKHILNRVNRIQRFLTKGQLHVFFYKHHLYKHHEAQKWQKNKHILSITLRLSFLTSINEGQNA